MNEIALAAQFLHHVLPRWERRPRLDADIRRVRVRQMPDTEIRHLRIGHGDGAVCLGGAERHAACHIFQHNSIVVEQLMSQPEGRAVFQRIAGIVTVQETGFCEADAIRLTGVRKAQLVVLKRRAVRQR